MSFEVPLVTAMTPVEPHPRGGGAKRYNAAITQGWQGNDEEHPDVSTMMTQVGWHHFFGCFGDIDWLTTGLIH
jgi:hypothetical protein